MSARELSARFITFPRTSPPECFVPNIVAVFDANSEAIAPAAFEHRFGSDRVLEIIRPDLVALGFDVEQGKDQGSLIHRPVFFGENGKPLLSYRVDAYHEQWRCGLEVEAGRGLLGGAVYRDLIQALVMTGVDHLVIALLNCYQPTKAKSRDFDKAVAVADALFGHSRLRMPFNLTLIGYGPHM